MAADAIFKIPTPILFAHRGGAREVPESTWEAFEHAATKAKADILELDVQLTKDSEIVVWHGPSMDNVWIEGLSPSLTKRRQKKKKDIRHFRWEELKARAWVIEPEYPTVEVIREEDVKKIPQRQLMLLSEFLDNVKQFDTDEKKIPVNIELKGEKVPGISASKFKDPQVMQAFVAILDAKNYGRTILVASTKKSVLDRFIKMGGKFPINVPIRGQLAYLTKVEPWYLKTVGWLLKIFLFIKKKRDLRGKAFQTSHHLLTKSLVDEVHEAGGAIHVFLTKFAFFKPLIQDAEMDEQVLKSAIFALLETGVDGIMTDYPVLVRKVLNQW